MTAGAFTDSEVMGNALTMLLAGEDTTSNTLAWMMYMMTEHPAVQARMQEEADRLLGPAHRPPDYASTGELRYIEAVAHETMRLKPVAPFLWVEPTEDIVIGDVHVPKGTAVNALTAHVAMSADNFADSKSFRPERWLEAAGHSAEGHNTQAFLPFGAGPRFFPVAICDAEIKRWLQCSVETSTLHACRMLRPPRKCFFHEMPSSGASDCAYEHRVPLGLERGEDAQDWQVASLKP